MKVIRLALGNRGYPIWVGAGALEKAARESARLFASQGQAPHAFIVADARLAKGRARLERALKRAGWKVSGIRVKASERFKDLRQLLPVYEALIRSGADRRTVLFALGGGVVGDAAGFVAGTFMRGIPWVGVPTTLLAQVDSSIGGKTAVNSPAGKNLIGVFHQPVAVACEPLLLKTLPRRELISGLGEMIKYGLIYDPRFFRRLERDWKKITSGDERALAHAISACARHKARAVARDERDVLGVREVLNFGHTVGHALESATRYATFRHGEAIILGMRAAVELSRLRGHLSAAAAARVDAFLAKLPVPRVPRRVSPRALLALLRHDKKAIAGRVRFVLLDRIGHAVLDRDVSDAEILAAITRVFR